MKVRKILPFLLGGLLSLGVVYAGEGAYDPLPDPSNPKTEPVLQGYVIDATTCKPVKGVIVTVAASKKSVPIKVATDANGFFKLEDIPGEVFQVFFDKKGYQIIKKSSVSIKEKKLIQLPHSREAIEEEFISEHPVLRLMKGW